MKTSSKEADPTAARPTVESRNPYMSSACGIPPLGLSVGAWGQGSGNRAPPAVQNCLELAARELEHDPEKLALGRRPDGWVPAFPSDKRGTRLDGDHVRTWIMQ